MEGDYEVKYGEAPKERAEEEKREKVVAGKKRKVVDNPVEIMV